MSHAVLKVFPTLSEHINTWHYYHILLLTTDEVNDLRGPRWLVGSCIVAAEFRPTGCVCVCRRNFEPPGEFTSWLLCFLRSLSSACRLDSAVTVRSSSSVTMANALLLLLLGLFSAASASHLLQRGKVTGCDLTGVQELAISVTGNFHFHITLWRLLLLFSYLFFNCTRAHALIVFIVTLLTLNNLIFQMSCTSDRGWHWYVVLLSLDCSVFYCKRKLRQMWRLKKKSLCYVCFWAGWKTFNH